MKKRWRLLAILLAIGAGAFACRPPTPISSAPSDPPMPSWFQDVTRQVGLNFVHEAGPVPTDHPFMPQIIGSGAALFDYDNDGRLDIYLVQNGGPSSAARNRLFHQDENGHFTDVSAGSGLDIAGYGMGVAIGDVNNDGWPDVLVTEYGGVHLFRNNGNGTFTDITKEAGLDNPQWGTSACFVDYDRDGWLDLVLVNYVDHDPTKVCALAGGPSDYCHPRGFAGAVTRLFHNRGRAAGAAAGTVRFEDVTLASGLGLVPGPGLGVIAADFDGDGWPDILVANDAQANRLWINHRDGTFTDEAAARGLAYNSLGLPQGNMGIAFGDLDDSGLFSVFITHLTEEPNTLWKQQPRGLFHDETASAGLAASRWRGTGFGTVFGDFDDDGALDLAIVNGRVSRSKWPVTETAAQTLGPHWSRYAERNQLFAGAGGGRFRDISAVQDCFCGSATVGRGLCFGDVDNDGGLDLLVTAVAEPARLYRNIVPNRGHWLLVRAIDPALKRDAYGAEVRVRAGGRCWRRWINPGSSYLCSHDHRAHFGLGSSAKVDGLEVLWPDGTTETFPGRAADQVVTLRKGEGAAR